MKRKNLHPANDPEQVPPSPEPVATGPEQAVSSPELRSQTDFPNHNQWLFGIGLLAVLLIAYWPALRGGFIWDDAARIATNAALRSTDGLWQIWFKPGAGAPYGPLTFTVFWFEYQLWGLHTLGYHLINVLLHGVAAILLWRTLRELKVPGAWLAGIIFALHPVCVMSVAWMTELENTLSTVLALGAAWAYLRAAGLGAHGGREIQGAGFKLDGWFYGAAVGLFSLALLANMAVCILPVTLLLVTWWRGRRLNWPAVWPVLAMAAVAVGIAVLPIHPAPVSAATGMAGHVSMADRVLISGRSFWFYLGKLFFPYPLTFVYSHWAVNARAVGQYIYPAAAAGVLLAAWGLRGRLGRGPLTALVHFIAATSLPVFVITAVTNSAYVSDQWEYFACVSVIALVAAAMVRALDRFAGVNSAVTWGVSGALALALATLTWRQSGNYVNAKTLWAATLARNPNSAVAHNNYGSILFDEGHFPEARAQFLAVLETQPDDALANYNLGNSYLQMGRFDEAAVQYEKVVRLDPSAYEARSNLGNLLLRRHPPRVDDAIVQFRKVLETHPEDATVHYNLGNALLMKGDLDGAIAEIQAVIAIDPRDVEARGGLANLLERQGRMDEAAEQLQKALQIQPAYAQALNDLMTLTWSLATSPNASARNGAKALEYAQRMAQKSNGSNPLQLSILAAAQAETGQFDAAAKTAQRAQQLATQQGNPDLAKSVTEQMAFYQAGKAYHQSPQPAAPAPITPPPAP